jgi:hypothetical protein
MKQRARNESEICSAFLLRIDSKPLRAPCRRTAVTDSLAVVMSVMAHQAVKWIEARVQPGELGRPDALDDGDFSGRNADR